MTKVTLILTASLLAGVPGSSVAQQTVFACDGLDGEVFYSTEARARCVETVPPSPGTALYRCSDTDGKLVYSGRIMPDMNCNLIGTIAPKPQDPGSRPSPPQAHPAWVTSQRTFGGYTCTQDCSGHEAGYAWAEENGIEDASDCDGRSNSFVEGCESYVDENNLDSDEDGIPDEDEVYDCVDDDGC